MLVKDEDPKPITRGLMALEGSCIYGVRLGGFTIQYNSGQ